LEDVKIFVKASLILVSFGIFVSTIILFLMKDWFANVLGINFSLLTIIIVLIASLSISQLFRSVLISSLQIKKLAVITIVSSSVKLALGIILVSISMGALGATMGFASYSIIASILLTVVVIKITKPRKEISKINLRSSLKNIFNASVVYWIPVLIQRVGIHLGTITVFGTQGASQAGVYFISFSIVGALTALFTVLVVLVYPVLSGMHDGRKRLTWRVIKICLIFGMPIVSSIIFYSEEIMQLFGKSYLLGTSTLEILLLSIFPTIVMMGIYYLVYAYGNYRQVFTIGLSSYGLTTILYFVLTPFYGLEGAAISYTVGSLIGFLVSIKIAKEIGMRIFWKDLVVILVIPSGLGFLISSTEIHPLITIFSTIIISYLAFLKLGVLTKSDVEESSTVLPTKISKPLVTLVNKLGKKLNRDYR